MKEKKNFVPLKYSCGNSQNECKRCIKEKQFSEDFLDECPAKNW